MAELEKGAVFAGHRIEGVAGRGGFGVVYKATHLALDHVVALKLISAAKAGEQSFRERFQSESRIAVSIRHPNVVAVHNAGEEDGLLFVTMDFIEGTDLRGLLHRKGRLEPSEAVPIVSQVAAALDAAHTKGLVHRDIKPGNVLLDESGGGEHVYLTDFGLSKQMEASSGVTATGAFVGTLDYVAPEQIKGDRLDARTDVYALGCVTYELLSGHVPFASQEEKVAKIYAHLQEDPPELLDAAPEIPAPLSEVVWRAMAKDPEARHPSAGDFARACEAALRGERPTEPERNVGVGAAAPTRAMDVLAAGGAGVAAAGAAAPETAAAQAPAAGADTAEVPPPRSEEPTTPAEAQPAPPAAPERAEPPTRAEPAPAKRSRGPWPLLAGLVVAAGVGVGAFLLLSGGDEPSSGGGGAQTATGGDRGPVARVAADPVGVAVGGGSVWVSSGAGDLTRLDERTGERQGQPIDLPGQGRQVKVDPDSGEIWVAVDTGAGVPGIALRLDPDGANPAQATVGAGAGGMAIGNRFAWTTDAGANAVTRIDKTTLATTSVPVGSQPVRAAEGEADVADGIWVTNGGGGTVSRILKSGDQVTPVPDVGPNPQGIASGGGAVWVAVQGADELVRIDPATDAVADRIPVGREPRSVAFGFGSVWVTNGADATVSRVDPDTGEVEEITDVGADPQGIVTGDRGVWVTSGAGGESGRGTVHLIEP